MKPSLAGLLLIGTLAMCSCSAQTKGNSAEEATRTKLINEFITLCEKRSTTPVGNDDSSMVHQGQAIYLIDGNLLISYWSVDA